MNFFGTNFFRIRGRENNVEVIVKRHYTAEEVFQPPKLAKGFVEKSYAKYMHTQGFYEVNIVLSGSATHTIGERSITVRAGDTFIIPPNVPHSYDGGEGFDVYHILLNPKFLEKHSADLQLLPAYSALFRIDPLLREKTTAKLHFRLSDSEIEELTPCLGRLTEQTCGSGAASAIVTNCEALSAIVWLCQAYERRERQVENSEDEAFQRSIAFIYENCARHITIAELSEIARMSRTAYTVKFKRVTGTSPGKFQSHYRVELAKNLLSETSLPISQIAAEVGCFDTSHLIRIFSAELGVTPTEYRRGKNITE